MIEQWLAALEGTGVARSLRDSVWIYPLVNAGHILGISLLIGSIVPLDLRLLGAWRSHALAPLWQVLTRTAAAGLAIAIVFGVLLFATRATEYAASSFFLAKMGIVCAAIVNALALRIAAPHEVLDATRERIGFPARPIGRWVLADRLAGGTDPGPSGGVFLSPPAAIRCRWRSEPIPNSEHGSSAGPGILRAPQIDRCVSIRSEADRLSSASVPIAVGAAGNAALRQGSRPNTAVSIPTSRKGDRS